MNTKTQSEFQLKRRMKSAVELGSNREHGERMRYMAGCRCDLCRAANTAYETLRSQARKAGDWNGVVSAKKARAHIAKLSKNGVGRRSISACSDVSDTVLSSIKNGTKKNIRARTERLILAVTPKMLADHAVINANTAWQKISALLKEGYTKSELAAELGYRTRALQLNKFKMTVRNVYEVEKLYKRLAGKKTPKQPTGPVITSTGGYLTEHKKNGMLITTHRMR